MDTSVFDLLRRGEPVYAAAADLPDVAEALTRAADLCFDLNNTRPSDSEARARLLNELLAQAPAGGVIHSPFRCDFGFNIRIGRNFVGNFGLAILDEAQVTIGNNVMIGPNTTLTTITHSLDAAERAAGLMQARPITIEDNVWIGAGVTVLPGVTIGEGAVVGAGAVVTRSIAPRTLALGVPARPVSALRSTPPTTERGPLP